MVDSDTIRVEKDNTASPPLIKLRNIDPVYNNVFTVKTSAMYNINGSVVFNVNVPQNKSFLIYVQNDDLNSYVLPNNDRLTVLLDMDLSNKQSLSIFLEDIQSDSDCENTSVGSVRFRITLNPVLSDGITLDQTRSQNSQVIIGNF
jgi:hypothetical protein